MHRWHGAQTMIKHCLRQLINLGRVNLFALHRIIGNMHQSIIFGLCPSINNTLGLLNIIHWRVAAILNALMQQLVPNALQTQLCLP